ncbi:hypothetical protein COCNU_scaffold004067G000020 [Cocos nucifera]|nr:hypothetical protein [Cocos nucifera]
MDLRAEVDSLRGKVAEAEHLMEEKAVENEDLQGVIWREEFISTRLKATLILEEEEKKKAKIRVIELEAQMSKYTLDTAAQAMEEFKASSEIKDLNIAFDQESFIKGFELCEGRVAWRFPELDLNFLKEESDEEAGPSGAAADSSPAKVVPDSSEPVVEVPKPVQEPTVATKAPVESAPEFMAAPRVLSSPAASSPKVEGL